MLENPTGCRLGTRPCRPNDLAEDIHCVTRHGRVPFDELPQLTQRRKDAVVRYSNGMTEHVPVDFLLEVTAIQGDTRIVERIARRAGGVFIPLETMAITCDDIADGLMALAQELGEDSSVIRRILRDGVISADEADEAEAELDQTIAAAIILKGRVRARVQQPSPTATGHRTARSAA